MVSYWGQLQNPVEMLKSNTNKNHRAKCPTSQIIFRSIIGGPEARGLLLTPARRTRSGRRPGQNAIQTEHKPGTGGLWFNQYLYHSSPVPGLSIWYSCGRGLRTVPVLRTPVKHTLEPPALRCRNFNNRFFAFTLLLQIAKKMLPLSEILFRFSCFSCMDFQTQAI